MKRMGIWYSVICTVIFMMIVFVVSCGKGSEEETDKTAEELPASAKTILFAAYHPSYGQELWKSDGTEAGTVLVKDINTTANPYEPLAAVGGGVPMGDTLGSSPQNITEADGVYFFAADDGVHGTELWKSDGTDAGTVLVKDIFPGKDVDGFPNDSSPYNFTVVNNTLFFTAYNDTYGSELWKSDGTTAGTVLVKDIYTGTSGSNPSYLTAISGTLYFQAYDSTYGGELWKSNGTAAGTVLVKDIYPGASGSNPYYLTAVGTTLYFQANDGSNGSELWKSNGTGSGTALLKDINPGESYGSSPNPLSSSPGNFTDISGTLFFIAQDYTHGRELWKSDGTKAGTLLVKDILTGEDAFGPLSSSPSYFMDGGDTLFFAADDGTHGFELWRSDGTEAGTTLVKDINEGISSAFAFGRDAIN
jgi:ELWxxDGT repeat protein